MAEEPQPEYVWDFGRPRRHPGRVWLIVGLSVAAVAIAAAVFLLFVLPGMSGESEPTSSPSASVSPTATSPASPSPSAPSTPTTAPSSPAPADPGLATFRDKVAPVLEAAATGLGYAREEGGMAAMQDVMLLQQDAERLAESVAPASVAQRWADAVVRYGQSLEALRAAYERGEDARSEDQATMAALEELNAIVAGE